MPKTVVTVHGIDSAGKWQEQVEAVLSPHFECIAIKYSDYRRFGALKLSFGSPLLACLAVVLLCFSIKEIVAAQGAASLVAISCLISVVAFGLALARRRRLNVLKQFKESLDRRVVFGHPPHLLAHSFGTFLTGRALAKFPGLRFDRMVFAGCVLPRGFNWAGVLAVNPKAFKQIRNEIAAKDWVPRLADFARFILLPGFGSAGTLGFSGPPTVHTMDTPNLRCPHCGPSSESAKIHNVVYHEYTHDDHFVGVGHAESFWLPFLWDIDPTEFHDFMDICAFSSGS